MSFYRLFIDIEVPDDTKDQREIRYQQEVISTLQRKVRRLEAENKMLLKRLDPGNDKEVIATNVWSGLIRLKELTEDEE